MYQNKALGVVGGVLGRNAKLKFQQRITGKSVFLIYQYTFWNVSIVNTINCNFAQTCGHSWSKVPQRRSQRWRCSQIDWRRTGGRQQCQERTSASLSHTHFLTLPLQNTFQSIATKNIFHFIVSVPTVEEEKVHLSCPSSRLGFYRASIPLRNWALFQIIDSICPLFIDYMFCNGSENQNPF